MTNSTHTVELPTPVATYLAAKIDRDATVILACFTEDALVHDEGRDHRGQAAIKAWLGDLASKYTLTYTVLGADRWDTAAAVRVEVAGNFPGSPVTLHQHFSLSGDRIAALTICP
ncbi:MAG TPA: nuclear transport factor 2 family protein [Pseudonocardia sp.]|jgi:ketosteroid isomerase-like protein|uniref:nuclear transport factor 2 family protein n=1 Tax=Pseudonocardia sp. TaxID=60912 RepID=UPI002C62BC25|nr:nuclear transport factor 2 family protein [Pseudonocardia sp.]HTF54914.1 nuclear transport factor 2 family protein [Pseudonocardia sp.]